MSTVTRAEIENLLYRQASLTKEMDVIARRIEYLVERYDADTPQPVPVPVPPPPVPTANIVPQQPAVALSLKLPTTPPPPASEPAPAPVPVKAAAAQPPKIPVTPAAPASKPAAANDSFEMQLGTVWLVRIGIVILLTGLVFLGNYAYRTWIMPHGPGGKIAMLLLVGGALFGTGARMEKKREDLANFGRVLMAGGIAIAYYTAYAAHFVTRLRIIESPLLGGGLLLALTGGIVWFADRKRSETLAVIAILLSYYTSAINPIGTFTLFSAFLLTAAAVYFVIRHGWVKLTGAALFATYASYGYWRFVHGEATAPVWISPAFLAGYWVLFTTAVFAVRTTPTLGRATFATLNNAAFFTYASLSLLIHQPANYWAYAVGFGVVLIGLGVLAWRRENENLALDATYFCQGAILATAGLIMKLTGPQMAILLAIESVLLGMASRARHPQLLDVAAILTAFGAVLFATQSFFDGSPHSLAIAITVCGAHVFSAWDTKRRLSLLNPARFSSGGTFRITLATFLGALAIYFHADPTNHAFLFAAIGVAGIASVHVLGIAELAIAAILFLGLALTGALIHPFQYSPALTVLVSGLAAAAWWQHQRRVALHEIPKLIAESACAAIAVAISIQWLFARYEFSDYQIVAPAIVIAFAILGIAIRSPGIFLTGHAPLLIGAIAFFTNLRSGNHWLPPLAMPAAFAVLALLARFSPARIRWNSLAQIHSILALTLTSIWALYYIPPQWRAVFFAAVGCSLLAASIRSPHLYNHGAASVAFSLLLLIWLPPVAQGWLAIAIAVFGVEITRDNSGRPRPDALQIFAHLPLGIAIAGWQLGTRLVLENHRDMLTVFWAVFALAILILGIVRRERIYRRAGLAVLAIAVASVFLVDVWRLGTVERIIAFLVLGAVLILLGFFYNRFRDFIRKWM